MSKQLGIICLFILGLGANFAEAANECRLKYKYGSSTNKYKYINKGQTINLTHSDFKMAQNIGRNDIRLTLQYTNLVGQTKTEYLYLIKSGSATLSLPPIPLIGKKLKKIQCKNYAAIIDTQAYLQQFGGSISSLISQISSTASNAIITAANNAKNAFSANSANTYKNNTLAAITAVNSALNAARNEATNTLRTNLSQHFPEVNQAVNASTQYGWKLGNSVLAQGEQNIRSTLAEVSRIDRKYAVSSTASKLVSINLAKDFPEHNRLKNHICKIQTQPIIAVNGGFGVLISELNKLDRKYQFSKTSGKVMTTLIKLPSTDISKLKKLSKTKNCSRDWGVLMRQIDSDSKILEQYLNAVKAELSKLRASQFKGSQGAFFREVQKLIAATDALIRENNAQKRRKDNMDKADKAHQKAFQQIRNDLGPIQDDLEKMPLGGMVVEAGMLFEIFGLPDWLTDDPERLKVLLEREIRAAKSYHRSIEIHEQGKLKVKAKFDAFLKQTGTTLTSATKLRIKLPRGSKLINLLKKPPQLKFLFATKNLVASCIQDYLKITQEAVEVMVKAIDQYINNIAKVLKDTIPDDVKKALVKLNKAVTALKNKKISTSQTGIIDNSFNVLKRSLNDLWSLLRTDPTKVNFKNRIESLFSIITRNNNNLQTEANKLTSEIENYGRSIAPVIEAIGNLNQVMVRHRNNTWTDVKTLLQKSMAFEVKWNSAKKTVRDIANCAKQYRTLIINADRAFLSRLQTFISSKAQVVANALPKNLKDKLAAVKGDVSAMLTKFNQFKNSSNQAYTAFQEMSTSRNAAIGSLIPIPQSNASQKVQTALSKVNNLKQKLQQVNSKWQSLNSAQQKLTTDLGYLVNQMRALGGGFRADAEKLISQPFNTSLVSSQVGGINNVRNKWNSASQTLPSRIAALVTGGVSTQVESQINQGLAYMNSRKSQLLTCVNTANTKRNSMGSSQQRANSLNKVMLGINTQVVAVRSSLNALLPPKFSIINDLSSAMNSARNLSNKIGNIGTAARTQFLSDINTLRSQLNAAKSCVISKHNQVNSKKTQLLNLLNN